MTQFTLPFDDGGGSEISIEAVCAPPSDRKRDSMPVGPGGPASLRQYGDRRIAATTRKLQKACRTLITDGLMISNRKVATLMGSSETTLGLEPHKRNLARYKRLAERMGLGKVHTQPPREGCRTCEALRRENEKLKGDLSTAVRKTGVLRGILRWHRAELAKALLKLKSAVSPDLPRRPRRPKA